MKKHNFITRLKATSIAVRKRAFKELVKYVSEKFKGQDFFPEKTKWAQATVDSIKDWSFLEAR